MTRGKRSTSDIALVRQAGRPTSVSSGRSLALLGAAAEPGPWADELVNRLPGTLRMHPWITAVLVVVLFAAPLAAEAQQAGKVWQVGLLGGQSARWAPFREGLRELGYVEGQNIVIDWRPSHGRAERLPDLAAELARLKVDVIVAIDNPATAAAQRATRAIPIVMVLAMDPVGTGFVGSLARPGGNTTGLSVQATELQGKALQLLKEATPAVSRVAVIWDPTEPGRQVQAREAETSAHALGLQVQLLEVRSPLNLAASSRR